MQSKTIRIFLASPGDVASERAIARQVIQQLGYAADLRERVELKLVAWDQPGAPAMEANLSPQEAIKRGMPMPSACDIVLVILWSRLGRPVSVEGVEYASGTYYEFHDAMQAVERTRPLDGVGKPRVLIYRRSEELLIRARDPQRDEKLAQLDRVDGFFQSISHLGINFYESPDEFGKQLENNLRTMIHDILDRAEAASASPAALPRWDRSPFPGLRAFTEADTQIYFGREREIDQLVRRVQDGKANTIAVVGASGSGKSSLVSAGLIPRLKTIDGEGRWLTLRFTPDEMGVQNPFVSLAAGLRAWQIDPRSVVPLFVADPTALAVLLLEQLAALPADARMLLYIDQFEELITTIVPAYVQPFIDLLKETAAYDRIKIIITLRGDFYGQIIEYPVLARLFRDTTFPLEAPDTIALYDMIVRPAERAHLRFEEGLDRALLNEAQSEPGALALMAYLLDELYRLRTDDGLLTWAAYHQLGGVQRAIGTRSETVFTALQDDFAAQEADPRKVLGKVFHELVAVKEDGTATRQRALLKQVTRTPSSTLLVERLREARLLTTGSDPHNQPYIEVAHEALLRSWDRLRDWIESVKDDLRLLRQVRLAAEEWDRDGRRDDYRWSHERLEPVYRMRDNLQVEFDPLTEAFVRPELEILVEQYERENSRPEQERREWKRLFILDRLREIGKAAVPTVIALLRTTTDHRMPVRSKGFGLGAASTTNRGSLTLQTAADGDVITPYPTHRDTPEYWIVTDDTVRVEGFKTLIQHQETALDHLLPMLLPDHEVTARLFALQTITALCRPSADRLKSSQQLTPRSTQLRPSSLRSPDTPRDRRLKNGFPGKTLTSPILDPRREAVESLNAYFTNKASGDSGEVFNTLNGLTLWNSPSLGVPSLGTVVWVGSLNEALIAQQVIPAVLACLKDEEPVLVKLACYLLAIVGDDSLGDALVPILSSHPLPGVRFAALWTARMLYGDHGVVLPDACYRAITDTNGSVAAAAMDWLLSANAIPAAAVPYLIDALEAASLHLDQFSHVHLSKLITTLKIVILDIAERENPPPLDIERASRALAQPALVTHAESIVYCEALDALRVIGTRSAAVPVFLSTLGQQNALQHGLAMAGLGQFGAVEAVERLVGILSVENPHGLNAVALDTLEQIGDKRAVPLLKLVQQDEVLASQIMLTLVMLDPSEAEAQVLHGLSSHAAGMRSNAAVLAGEYQVYAAIPALIEIVIAGFHDAAQTALQCMDAPDLLERLLTANPGMLKQWKWRVGAGDGADDTRPFTMLKAALMHGSPAIRPKAAEILAWTGAVESWRILLETVNQGDPLTRAAALPLLLRLIEPSEKGTQDDPFTGADETPTADDADSYAFTGVGLKTHLLIEPAAQLAESPDVELRRLSASLLSQFMRQNIQVAAPARRRPSVPLSGLLSNESLTEPPPPQSDPLPDGLDEERFFGRHKPEVSAFLKLTDPSD